MSGFRRYGRKPLRYAIRFSHELAGDFQTETQNVSDSGVFVRDLKLVQSLSIGETVNAQLISELNAVEDAQLKVVRMTEEGVGLAFE